MSEYIGIGIFCIVFIMLAQSIIGSYFSDKKIRYFHESGIAILLGIGLSAAAYFGFNYTVSLDKSVFLYVFLPAIIFSEGLTMKKRHFFKNMKYICTYGFLGTIITFVTMTFLLNVICNNQMIQIQVKGKENGEYFNEYVDLNLKELTLFSAALSSKDSFIASTMIDHHSHPVLFHVIFGEGIINDVTSLILFDSFEALAGEHIDDFKWTIIPKIFGIMLESFLVSVIVGVLFGGCSSLILKSFEYLNKTVVHETLIIFICSYGSYCIVEYFHFSGVLSLLFCGFIIGHYSFYNLSVKGQVCVKVVFQTISSGAENFLYAFLGFTTFSFYRNEWNLTLIGYVFLFLILGRFISVFFMSAILRVLFRRRNFKMGIREQLVLQFTGISRGILGYILMNQVESENYKEVLQSTMLGVLIITTLTFGIINPKFIDIVLPPHQDLSHLTAQVIKGNQQQLINSRLLQKIKGFNQNKIKPFLIRDFNNRQEQIQFSKIQFKEDKFELLRPDGIPKDEQMFRLSLNTQLQLSRLQYNQPQSSQMDSINEQTQDENAQSQLTLQVQSVMGEIDKENNLNTQLIK